MPYFWDTSAIGAFIFDERQSDRVREYNRPRKALRGYLSFLGELEIESVFQRKLNQGELGHVKRQDFRGLLRSMLANMTVIHSDQKIVDQARRMIAEYSLRSADALQLGTAHRLQDELGKINFLSFDEKLNRSALAEGMDAPLLP